MTKSKELCRGCYNDYYNHGGGGAEGCWSFASAEVCKRAFIHLSMVPPWAVKPVTTLSCYRKEKHVAVKPDHPQLTADKSHRQKYDGGTY